MQIVDTHDMYGHPKYRPVNTNLRRVNKVHLKQTGLQMSFSRPVVLQSIQQEGSALLDQVSLHEHVDNLRRREHILSARSQQGRVQELKRKRQSAGNIKVILGGNNRLKSFFSFCSSKVGQ